MGSLSRAACRRARRPDRRRHHRDRVRVGIPRPTYESMSWAIGTPPRPRGTPNWRTRIDGDNPARLGRRAHLSTSGTCTEDCVEPGRARLQSNDCRRHVELARGVMRGLSRQAPSRSSRRWKRRWAWACGRARAPAGVLIQHPVLVVRLAGAIPGVITAVVAGRARGDRHGRSWRPPDRPSCRISTTRAAEANCASCTKAAAAPRTRVRRFMIPGIENVCTLAHPPNLC